MHIGGGLSRTGAAVRTVHLAEILAAEKSGPASVAADGAVAAADAGRARPVR